MIKYLAVFLCLYGTLLGSQAVGDDPKVLDVDPTPIPAKKVVFTLPKSAPVITPVAPNGAITLSPDQIFVVQGTEEFYVESFPPESIVPTYDQGPVKFKGKFSDGTGLIETRVVPGPFIATIDIGKVITGDVWVALYPKAGVNDQSEIVKILIKIGVAPQPPPTPVPDPKPVDPIPVPPTPVVPTGFRVMMIYETKDALPRGQEVVINSTKIREYLSKKCVLGPNSVPEWRVWDDDIVPTALESPTMLGLFNSVKSKLDGKPKLVVAVNGKADVYPLPDTEEQALTFLKTQGGE